MKTILASLLSMLLLTTAGFAADPISYTATGDPNGNPDGVDQSANAVNVWNCTLSGDPSTAGSYALGAFWVTYSVSTEAVATHTFTGGPLGLNQSVFTYFANQNVSAGNQVGIDLLSGTNVEFTLYFQGGSSNYQYSDGSVTGGDTGVGYLNTVPTPFTFALTGPSSYSASFDGQTWTGTLDSGTIDGIDIFNNAQDPSAGSVYFANLEVGELATPEPKGVVLLLLGVGVLVLTRITRHHRSEKTV